MTARIEMPPTALAIVTATASEYGLTAGAVINPPGASPRAAPEEYAARNKAIARLWSETIDGRPRWPAAVIGSWFGMNRQRLHVARKAAGEFVNRSPGTGAWRAGK